MWDSETNLDYQCVLSGKKKILLHKTCSSFTIPSKGVVILFDLCNYQDYPEDSIWRNLGNHLNIEFGDGRQPISPPIIKTLVNSKNYSNRRNTRIYSSISQARINRQTMELLFQA